MTPEEELKMTEYIVKKVDIIDSKIDSINSAILKLENRADMQERDIRELKAEVNLLKNSQVLLKSEINDLKIRDERNKSRKWDKIEQWLLNGILAFIAGCIVYIVKNGKIGEIF